jgi:hypothetical protein
MAKQKGHLQLDSKGYKLTLDIVTYNEEGQVIAYSPALELSGVGHTDQEAIKDLLKVVTITFDYARTKGTFEVMLFDLGWRKLSEKAIEAPTFSDDELTKRLNVPFVRRYDRQLAISA